MTEVPSSCESCPRTLEAQAIFRSDVEPRYCFDCPVGFRPSRFEALLSRAGAGSLAIRSCRRVHESAAV